MCEKSQSEKVNRGNVDFFPVKTLIFLFRLIPRKYLIKCCRPGQPPLFSSPKPQRKIIVTLTQNTIANEVKEKTQKRNSQDQRFFFFSQTVDAKMLAFICTQSTATHNGMQCKNLTSDCLHMFA